jgi:hypothetical protein
VLEGFNKTKIDINQVEENKKEQDKQTVKQKHQHCDAVQGN